MRRTRHLATSVLALAACGRVSFVPLVDDSQTGDGGLPPVVPWAAVIGGGGQTEGTVVTAVHEDASGELWLSGTAQPFGPNYVDGWIGKLDGSTGALLLGGLRGFTGNFTNSINGSALTADSLLVAGDAYGTVNDQQPTLGELSFDGTWQRVLRMDGELGQPGDFETFFDIIQTTDGGILAVGETRAGTGSCSTCKGTDALIVRMGPDRSFEWAHATGTPFCDESLARIVLLPDGDFIAVGGGVGTCDYSMGAETDVDSTASFMTRVGADGTVRWSRRINFGNRGALVNDAVLDPESAELVIVGHTQFGDVPYFARMTQAGTMTEAQEVTLDDNRGSVTAVEIGDDGAVYIAGFERAADFTSQTMFVARLTTSRDGIEWSRRAALGYSGSTVGLARTRRGDLVAWSSGAGPMQTDALVLRIGADGTSAACGPLMAATLALEPRAEATVAVTSTLTVVQPTAETLAGATTDFPPSATTRCSP